MKNIVGERLFEKCLKNKKFYFIITLCFLFYLYCVFFKKKPLEVKINNPIKNLKINKAFVINLDFKPERWKKTKENLLKIGLKENQIERFSATYGIKVKIYDYQNNKTFLAEKIQQEKLIYGNTYKIECSNNLYFDYIYKDDPYFPEKQRHFTAGEIGCLCSHLRALQEGLKRNYDNILVLEDDIDVVDKKLNLNLKLQEMAKYLPEDFELLHLGIKDGSFRIFKNKKYFKAQNKELKLVNNMSDFYNLFQGNFALFFSKKGMKAFLEKSKKFQTLAADILYSKISTENNKTYFSNEDFFYQYINYSSTADAKGINVNFNKIIILDSGERQKNIAKIISLLNASEFNNYYRIIKEKDFIKEFKNYNSNKKLIIFKDNFIIQDNFNFDYFLYQQNAFRNFFRKEKKPFIYLNNNLNVDKVLFSHSITENRYIFCVHKIQLINIIKTLDPGLLILTPPLVRQYVNKYEGQNNDYDIIFKILHQFDKICFFKT